MSHRDDENNDRADEWHDREHHRRHAEQNRVRQSDEQKADAVHNAVANRDEHLAAEKCDQIVVDGLQNENEFVFEGRILHGKIIRPFGSECPLFPAADKTRKSGPAPVRPARQTTRRPRCRLSAKISQAIRWRIRGCFSLIAPASGEGVVAGGGAGALVWSDPRYCSSWRREAVFPLDSIRT